MTSPGRRRIGWGRSEAAITICWPAPGSTRTQGRRPPSPTRKSQQQAPLVQIDHIVALSVAWRDGARDWTDDQRLTFANDLRNLVATSGATNQAKGGSDAASWRPIPSAQCTYAVRYVGIKAGYALAVTPAESDALAGMLHRCG